MINLSIVIIIIIGAAIFLAIGYYLGTKLSTHFINKQWEEKIPEYRKDAINRSRAGLGGKFSENLAPYFPNFPYHPTELRWLGGSPTDYVAFKGMDNDQIEEIVFLEIKSGNSQLTKREKQIKEVVEKKKVRFEEYRVDEGITRGEK
ncbi:hypothetical protein J4444_00450 [Candidatus Woesearchaeota archaeon]|nr:hypothetical protein [Candidatus Woesearchaeota archaeon]